MGRPTVYRNFILRFCLEAGGGAGLLFVLLRLVAPALISAHDTLQLIVGVAVLAACPVILVLLGFRLWRSWSVFRRGLREARPVPARLTVH